MDGPRRGKIRGRRVEFMLSLGRLFINVFFLLISKALTFLVSLKGRDIGASLNRILLIDVHDVLFVYRTFGSPL